MYCIPQNFTGLSLREFLEFSTIRKNISTKIDMDTLFSSSDCKNIDGQYPGAKLLNPKGTYSLQGDTFEVGIGMLMLQAQVNDDRVYVMCMCGVCVQQIHEIISIRKSSRITIRKILHFMILIYIVSWRSSGPCWWTF